MQRAPCSPKKILIVSGWPFDTRTLICPANDTNNVGLDRTTSSVSGACSGTIFRKIRCTCSCGSCTNFSRRWFRPCHACPSAECCRIRQPAVLHQSRSSGRAQIYGTSVSMVPCVPHLRQLSQLRKLFVWKTHPRNSSSSMPPDLLMSIS